MANKLDEFEASKHRELNDTAGVQLSASEFRWLCDLARRNPILHISLGNEHDRPDLREVRHIDGNPRNNEVSNLSVEKVDDQTH